MPHTCKFCNYRNCSREVIEDHERRRHSNKTKRKDRSRSPHRRLPVRRLTTPDFTLRRPTRPCLPPRRARRLPSLSPVPSIVTPIKEHDPRPPTQDRHDTPMETEPSATPKQNAKLSTQTTEKPETPRPPVPLEPNIIITTKPPQMRLVTPIPRRPATSTNDDLEIIPDPLPEEESPHHAPPEPTEVPTTEPPSTEDTETNQNSDTLSVSCDPDPAWEQYTTTETETQTHDPNDHLSRLMTQCRIALDDAKIIGPVSDSEEINQFHALANGEVVTRCTETLHLPGGGFYTRFYYKVTKTPR